jgi:hypothetical protein
MYRRLFKFTVTTLTILTANLLTNLIANQLVIHKYDTKPLRFTLIAMAVITLVFYPLFTKLEEWLNGLSKKFVKAGHSFAGKYIGLLLMFFTGLFILMCFYAHLWYNISVITLILSGRFFYLF